MTTHRGVKVAIKIEHVAPQGYVWACAMCGKTAEHKYGNYEGYKASIGWDESCMLNADLIQGEVEDG